MRVGLRRHNSKRAGFPPTAQLAQTAPSSSPKSNSASSSIPDQASPSASPTKKNDRKSADFVLCDPHTFAPQLIIELDDKSHTPPTKNQHRKSRDDFVNNALNAAGIPLLRIPAAPNYNPAAIEQRIRAAINPATD